MEKSVAKYVAMPHNVRTIYVFGTVWCDDKKARLNIHFD